MAGRKVRAPKKTLAVVDHNVPTTDRSKGIADPESAAGRTLAENAKEFGVEYFNEHDKRQGIVHVIGPEQGFTLPGTTIVCGDSHTSTHGAFGALAHGIGTSEVEHVLATQTLIQKKAKNMRVDRRRQLPEGVTAKDIILAIIGEIGTAGGTGYVIEYAGEAIRALSMEGRMTVCNMSIEGGARAGLIAPDEKAYELSQGPPDVAEGRRLGCWPCATGKRCAPTRARISITRFVSTPRSCRRSSPGALARRRRSRSPASCRSCEDRRRRKSAVEAARAGLYGPQGPAPRSPTSARPHLHRLLHQRPHRGPARRREGRRGQESQRERQRDDRAGLGPREGAGRSRRPRQDFQGRLRMARAGLLDVSCDEPDKLAPEERCASTSNRNFEGRQGFKGRTHLVSPHGGSGGDRRPLRRCALVLEV
jgi:3-isopropylmalate/(R)-2-methylmalate dehydratase large subunit